MFPPPTPKGAVAHLAPDWAIVHQELKRKGVTLSLLWQEYKAQTPGGFQYSWFCQAYRAWAAKLDVVMRQSHRAGLAIVSEKYFTLGYKEKYIKILQRYLMSDSNPSNQRKTVFMRSCVLDEIQHYDARLIDTGANYAFIFNAMSRKN